MPLLHDVKREVLGPRRDRDSYYLVYFGTKPSGRGRGYARLLIEQMAVRVGSCFSFLFFFGPIQASWPLSFAFLSHVSHV